jgi:hypothetical protein
MLTTAAIDALLKHIYQNLAWANVGDAAGLQPSAAAGNFYISLHTADPGAGGSQTTNEATYTGYARIPIVRSASGFTVASGVVSNAALAAFAACTGGSNSITHFGIGSASSGAGNLQDRGLLGSNPRAVRGRKLERHHHEQRAWALGERSDRVLRAAGRCAADRNHGRDGLFREDGDGRGQHHDQRHAGRRDSRHHSRWRWADVQSGSPGCEQHHHAAIRNWRSDGQPRLINVTFNTYL